MNKTPVNQLLSIVITSVLFVFGGCKNSSTEENRDVAMEDNSIVEAAGDKGDAGEKLTASDTIGNRTEKDTTLDSYLGKLNSNHKLQGVRLDFYSDLIKGKEKYNFEYLDKWFSIDVNDDGVTYTGVYELRQNDTLLHYVSVVPEIYMEGSFVNYEAKPWFEYCYKDNRLTKIKHHDPENEKTSIFSEKLDKKGLLTVGDSIKKLINDYWYLDSSRVRFDGVWAYPENSASYVFRVQLKQIGSFVYGNYCSFTPNKHDCGDDEDCKDSYINGYVYSDTLHLEFFSCYARSAGTAKLYFSNDTLNWHTINRVENSLVPEKTSLEL